MPIKYEKTSSGLVVPAAPPEPPKQVYAKFQLQDEASREKAKAALSDLWDACGFTDGFGSIVELDRARLEWHYNIYRMFGELLLGKECPEKEILT